jgi:hypothetical protein
MTAKLASTPTMVAKITSRLMLALLQVAVTGPSALQAHAGRRQPASPVPFAAQQPQQVRADGRPASARRALVALRATDASWLFTCLRLIESGAAQLKGVITRRG